MKMLIVDPQRSFNVIVQQDQQQLIHDGELALPNGLADMERLAKLIDKIGHKLDDITVTLDSHHLWHISHPIWFKNDKGVNPNPFTIMKNVNGEIIGSDGIKYNTSIIAMQRWTLDYLHNLETTGKYLHCIWPPHCLIGSRGFQVVESLFNSLINWSHKNKSIVNFVTKGSNCKVEHFSAVKSEINDPDDFTTSVNTNFVKSYTDAKKVLLAGQARSHCIARTCIDIAEEFCNGNLGQDDEFIKKTVLLNDCCSDVPGFESYGESFVKDMSARGMKVCNSTDL